MGANKDTRRSQRNVNPSERSRSIRSYYASQKYDSELDLSRNKRRGTSRSLRKNIVIIGYIVFGLVVFWALCIMETKALIILKDPVPAYVDPSRYQSYGNQLVESSILNRFKFTLRSSSLQDAMIKEFPEIESIHVGPVILGRKPVMKFRLQELPLTLIASDKEYAVAQNGTISGEATEFNLSGTLTLRDESGLTYQKGQKVLRSDDVHFIELITRLLVSKGRVVDTMRITNTPREIYIKTTDVPYEVRMFLEEDPLQQIGAWLAAERAVGESGGIITQYIDVRAGEKVFWQ